MRNKIIIISILVITLIIGVFIFIQIKNQTNPINSTSPTLPTSSNSFFPQAAIKSIINVVSNLNSSIENGLTNLKEETDNKPEVNSNIAQLITPSVVDFGFLNNINQSTTSIIYVQKMTGALKTIPEEDWVNRDILLSSEINKLSYTTTKTGVDIFNKKKDSLNFQKITIPKNASSTIQTKDLNQNIIDLFISPDNKQYLTINHTNSRLNIELADINSSIITPIFSSPIKEWLIEWTTPNIISLQTKPSSGLPGFLFHLNPQTKIFKNVLGPINGLNSKTSPDGKKIIYSENSNGKLQTFIRDFSKDTNDLLDISTFADKCTWINTEYILCAIPKNINTAAYPDDWYNGKISFNDNLWIIDIKFLEPNILNEYGKPLGTNPIDAINLKVAPDKKSVYFINKIDSSLWSFDLTSLEL